MGIALGLLGGLFLGGSVYLSPARLSKTIDRDLRNRLGHVQALKVFVRGPSGVPVMKGRFDSVEITARGFNGDDADIPIIEGGGRGPAKKVGLIKEIRVDARDFVYDGTRVAQALVMLKGLRFDEEAAQRKQLRLVELESGTAEIRLTESELRASALARLTGVIDPEFTFEGDRLLVSGKHKVSVVPVPFSLRGRLEVKNGTEVHLTDTDLRVSVVPVPDRLEHRLLADLNPVYIFKSSNQLPFKVEVASVKIAGGELIAQCKVLLKAELKPEYIGIP